MPTDAEADRPSIDAAKALGQPTRAEIFGLLSSIYRALTLQNMALLSVKEPTVDNFDSEHKRAHEVLNKLLPELERFVGIDARDD